MVEFLYTMGDGSDRPLYIGVSGDWSLRLRQHALSKPWVTAEVQNVTIERFPDRPAVLEAERLAIRSHRPRYNVQHNLGAWDEPSSGSGWTVEQTVVAVILVAAAVYVICKVTKYGVAKYQAWQADRQEYLRWKEERDQRPAEPSSPPAPASAAPAELRTFQASSWWPAVAPQAQPLPPLPPLPQLTVTDPLAETDLPMPTSPIAALIMAFAIFSARAGHTECPPGTKPSET
jgi:hypothetical protein